MVDAFAVWAIFRSNQWSTTDLSKAVVCVVLSVGKVHIKDPSLLIEKNRQCGDSGFPLIETCHNDHMLDGVCDHGDMGTNPDHSYSI